MTMTRCCPLLRKNGNKVVGQSCGRERRDRVVVHALYPAPRPITNEPPRLTPARARHVSRSIDMASSQRPQRPSIHISSFPPEPYTDARLHGYQGQTRTVRLPGAAPSGGGAIAKSEDGMRCVVAGKESVFFDDSVCMIFSQPIGLRIMR